MSTRKIDTSAGDPENIASAIFESVHATMHAFRSEQYQVLRDSPYELTHMEGKILGYFERNPGAKLNDIVRHSGRDKGQLARNIKTLKSQGLLNASKDANDRRSVSLELTDAGKAVCKDLQQELDSVANRAVANLDPAEQRHLYQLLEKVRHGVMKTQS
tara:strand:+ start:38232 stop:38708 length:477 start_codon:yes stop_codon:yes gene_type:complete